MKVLFALFDADRNGKLAKQEIKEMIEFITGGSVQNEDVTQVMQLIVNIYQS